MNTAIDMSFQRVSPDTLRIERLLDAPVDTVWHWLVDPTLRAQWFTGGTAPTREGELDLVFDHDNLSAEPVPYPEPYAKWKGAVSRERVLRIEAPRLLTHTWDGGKEGQVTFELFPGGSSGDKTRLILTHSGITGPAPYMSFTGGWLSHLAVLQTRLAGGVVRDFWALHQKLETELAARL
jgi:uncharacterized protein YndB with AHSA1/START domain